ncbi:hypothetical protein AWC38_SpisGene10190 [Stylophora pistillata]|uniref:RNA-directed DNA polymerase from mobile element jockey n=1 Tax=Stylophora pistillata TaxID=50429 RepID=A0A2B4S8Q0_STYPI|nr:hypothetical protein AWC38_SpisGene10190 [Stylophora pistillata]
MDISSTQKVLHAHLVSPTISKEKLQIDKESSHRSRAEMSWQKGSKILPDFFPPDTTQKKKTLSQQTDQLRSLLPQFDFDISKLQNFVITRKDASITFSIPPITENKNIDCLKNISSNKASGIDDISARMLILAAPIIAPSIAKLINYLFITSLFPQRWKTAKVTPLFKGGGQENVNNYRPMSVLSELSKSQKDLHHSTMEPQMALFFIPKLIEKQVISKSKTNELFSAGQHTSPDSMHALRDNDEGL